MDEFEVSLPDLLAFLGGGVDTYIQSTLLGSESPLTHRQCEEVRSPCVSAVLVQHPYLQVPYSCGEFDTDESRKDWFSRQSPDLSYVWLRPVEKRQGSVRVSGVGTITYMA